MFYFWDLDGGSRRGIGLEVMMRFFSSSIGFGIRALWSCASRFFSTIGTKLPVPVLSLFAYCRDQGKVLLKPSPVETVPRLVLLNVMLQTFDGLATYQGLSLGFQEGNPVMHAAMVQWGVAETLLGTKGAACLTLPFFLLLRHRRLSVWALTLIAGVYLVLSFVPWLTILLTEARQI